MVNLLDMPDEVLERICFYIADTETAVNPDDTLIAEIRSTLSQLQNKRLSHFYLQERCRELPFYLPLNTRDELRVPRWYSRSFWQPSMYCKRGNLSVNDFVNFNSQILASLVFLKSQFPKMQAVTLSTNNVVLQGSELKQILDILPRDVTLDEFYWYLNDYEEGQDVITIRSLQQLLEPFTHLTDLLLHTMPFGLDRLHDILLSVDQLSLFDCNATDGGAKRFFESIVVKRSVMLNANCGKAFLLHAPRTLKHLSIGIPRQDQDPVGALQSLSSFRELELLAIVSTSRSSITPTQWVATFKSLSPTLQVLTLDLEHDEEILYPSILEALSDPATLTALSTLRLYQEHATSSLPSLWHILADLCGRRGIELVQAAVKRDVPEE
jgi:hypothetical protein